MLRRKSGRDRSLSSKRQFSRGGSFADVCGNLPQVWKDVHRQMLENGMRGGTTVQLEGENNSD